MARDWSWRHGHRTSSAWASRGIGAIEFWSDGGIASSADIGALANRTPGDVAPIESYRFRLGTDCGSGPLRCAANSLQRLCCGSMGHPSSSGRNAVRCPQSDSRIRSGALQRLGSRASSSIRCSRIPRGRCRGVRTADVVVAPDHLSHCGGSRLSNMWLNRGPSRSRCGHSCSRYQFFDALPVGRGVR